MLRAEEASNHLFIFIFCVLSLTFSHYEYDSGIITWLKKGYSLWKFKAKARPKNKCPW